jgi:predicted transcriptional regulator
MQALYDTRNRPERIRFAHQKRNEGYTLNDIALLLHSSVTTISKYLSIPDNEIPEVKENVREIQHLQEIEKKKDAVQEVRSLYAQGHEIDEISRLTGHIPQTVINYLKPDCPIINGHYDDRRPRKLAPYESEVIQMSAKGITYIKIHEYICQKGYAGTVSSLRMFMQKERTHRRAIKKQESEPVEYIPRKFMCQLIYRELECIKGLTKEQYNAAIKKYPQLDQLYTTLKEFHRVVFSQKSEELDLWIEKASVLNFDELSSFISGLKNDLQAVKNGIDYKYNNGLAEGSVNKIKLIKRIMYGRNSFQLLKAKILLNERYYQIN